MLSPAANDGLGLERDLEGVRLKVLHLEDVGILIRAQMEPRAV